MSKSTRLVTFSVAAAALMSPAQTPQVPRVHDNDEICNVMGIDPHPCTRAQASLMHTPHEHDAKGNLVIMSKNADGSIKRTTVNKAAWLAKKQKEIETADKASAVK